MQSALEGHVLNSHQEDDRVVPTRRQRVSLAVSIASFRPRRLSSRPASAEIRSTILSLDALQELARQRVRGTARVPLHDPGLAVPSGTLRLQGSTVPHYIQALEGMTHLVGPIPGWSTPFFIVEGCRARSRPPLDCALLRSTAVPMWRRIQRGCCAAQRLVGRCSMRSARFDRRRLHPGIGWASPMPNR